MALTDERLLGLPQFNPGATPTTLPTAPLPNPLPGVIGGLTGTNTAAPGNVALGGVNTAQTGTIPGPFAPFPDIGGTLGGVPPGGGTGTAVPITGAGGFTAGQTGATSADPDLIAALKARLLGQTGGPDPGDLATGITDPLFAILERQSDVAKERFLGDVAQRGFLRSGETPTGLADLEERLFQQKGALAGQFRFQAEQLKQENIRNAIQSFGILEGNRISANATITSANIGAASRVQSAALAAGATTEAARIGAQARLQEAGMDAQLALTQLQQQKELSLIDLGIDPVAFANDPATRDAYFEYKEYERKQEQDLIDLILSGGITDLSTGGELNV